MLQQAHTGPRSFELHHARSAGGPAPELGEPPAEPRTRLDMYRTPRERTTTATARRTIYITISARDQTACAAPCREQRPERWGPEKRPKNDRMVRKVHTHIQYTMYVLVFVFFSTEASNSKNSRRLQVFFSIKWHPFVSPKAKFGRPIS